ncbi:transposase [Saccharothrix xinjiangensis]|uniref:Transposase n=1 Tax=Saccharothrix xinjiangensis TaxID=204798 RepID=A0ABV9Y7N1_9PSEU
MGKKLARRLVPDPFWDLVSPLTPRFGPRPQGGGTVPLEERTVFTAVVFVLTSGCAWHRLPSVFEVSPATAHRRFSAWTESGLWMRLRQALREGPELGNEGTWVTAVVDAAVSRNAPTPVDRPGEPGEAAVIARRSTRPGEVPCA